MSARACDNVDSWRKSITARAHLSISWLPLVHVVRLELWLRRSLHHLIIDGIEAAFLEAGGPLVHLHVTLRLVLRFCRRLVEQIVGARLGILVVLLIAVDVLAGTAAANNDGLAHVGIVIDLATFIVACWTLTARHHVILSELSRLLLIV